MKNIKFKGVTILLPVIDENKSLKKTLSIILRDKSNDIKKVIIILDKNKSLKTSIGMAKLLSTKNNKISIYFQ